ncbi:MAG: helicase C-terminal domain-containing protein [Desulfitobacteriaceae bacterium]
MKEKIVGLEIETTGLDPKRDEILEFAAWQIEEGQTPQSLHFLIRPRRKVPQKVLRLTGIEWRELETARILLEYKEEILEFFENAVLVGHNISFNISMLEHGLGVHLRNQAWDTMQLSQIFFPSLKYYRLGSIAERLSLEIPERMNRASANAWLAWGVLEACWKKGLDFDLSFYDQAQRLVLDWQGNGFIISLQKEVSRRFPNRPIRTDLALILPKDSLFREPSFRGKVPDSADWVISSLSADGELAQALPGYESRQGQVAMAQAVTGALVRSEHLVVEAGTGTGKSLAYLVPGLWWARKTGKKVVVATHTIPLQEQLREKDLPILEKSLPFSFRSILIKGKANYFCLRNWLTHWVNIVVLSNEERLASLSILAWLRETQCGDLQELPQNPGIFRIWPRLSAENCTSARCPQAGACFLLKIRQKAEEADLLIVNHSLLFSDIKTDYKVLPEYSYAIIDEAHHLYSSALEQLGTEVTLEKISRALDRIYRPMGPSIFGNIMSHSAYYSSLTGGVWERFSRRLDVIPASSTSCLEQAQTLFKLLTGVIGERSSLRMVKAHKNQGWWAVLEVQVENLAGRFGELIGVLEALSGFLELEEADELEELRRELREGVKGIEALLAALPQYLELENSSIVTWLEKFPNLAWKSSPVDVSSILQKKLFNRLDAAILTSATLNIAGSFTHFLEEIGLPQDTRTLLVDSPFDYESQMQFYVVKGLIQPHLDNVLLPGEVAKFISEVTQRMRGRTLVLFTSHSFLQATYFPLREHLEQTNIEVLGQGIDGGRTAILEEFKRNPQSVLLGASSFWEGIDIIGEALSCVILVKLPFWPPTLPLVEARAEFLEAQGKDSFRELFLPEAIIRFKQGFGRLIRSRDDRGVVILLDWRIAEKSYGRLFLSSLPVHTHIRGDREQILRKLEAWLQG